MSAVREGAADNKQRTEPTALSRDLAVGFANSTWSALIGLATVPLYVHYVGIESYGLIGFFATIQAVLQLFDVGLSATVNREAARHFASCSLPSLARLLHTLSILYWLTALLLAFVVAVLSPVLATTWLSSQHLSVDMLRSSVSLLGCVVATRWPIGLYQGILLGAHGLKTTSLVNMFMSTVGAVGAVLVLAQVSASIEAFFIWQAFVGLAHALTLRWFAWRLIGTRNGLHFDLSVLRSIGGVTAGMSGVAVTGMLLLQGDKLILSKVLPLGTFGQYVLATVIASGLNLILIPTFSLIFPRLSALVLGSREELVRYYRRGTRTLSAALFPFATVAFFFSRDILMMWTANRSLADDGYPVLRLYLIGSALNGVMLFPYALQLASGRTRTPVTINLILLVVMLPLTTLLALNYGAIGGSAAWALLNFLYVLLGTWLTHRVLLPGIGSHWLMYDVGVPLAATLFIAGPVFFWLHQLVLPRPALLVTAFLAAAFFSLLLMQVERNRGRHSFAGLPRAGP
jgi:O-antigen/teichoic acid export membrane protein